MNEQNNELDLAPMVKFIEKMNEGDLLNTCRQLCFTVYLLHFLPLQENDNDYQEKQNACYLLMGLNEAFAEMYYNSIGKEFIPLEI